MKLTFLYGNNNALFTNMLVRLDIFLDERYSYSTEMSGNNDFYKEFGQLLRDARKTAGMSQADLASAIGLTRTSISNIEKGRQKVVLYTFATILKVLAKRPEELLPPPRGARNMDDMGIGELEPDSRDFVERALGETTKENDENPTGAN